MALLDDFRLYRAMARHQRALCDWDQRDYAAPSPHYIKIRCLLRNAQPRATWVETGTYRGETTSVLARYSERVISIEPEPDLYRRAKEKFAGDPKVEIINATSEEVLPELLEKMKGPVNFWLDGHYSAGVTFKGEKDTPICAELSAIQSSISNLTPVTVLIDDVRCFRPHIKKWADYPSLDFLVEWSREMKLYWHIEHDIFIASSEVALD